MKDLEIVVQSFDIPRIVSVYPDQAGVRWWTKAWFNNRKEGEASVEITPYDEIFADIVIRVDNAAEVVVKGYSCVYLSEEAILVSGIKHKDIEALVAMTGAKSWMHYLK